MELSTFFQNYGSLVLSIVSILIAGGALYVTYQASYTDRLNANTWATYEAYNNDRVRNGRAVARKALKAHKGGFANKEEYEQYFFHSGHTSKETQELQEQEQNLHDLLAFYHQVGLLLKKGQVDQDFILLMLGEGLDNRWALLNTIPTFYEDTDPEKDFPYGGMYILHKTYLTWKQTRFAQLKKQFREALTESEAGANQQAASIALESQATGQKQAKP